MQSWIATRVDRFARDEHGGTAIEYALVASFISIAIVGVASSIGNSLTENFYDKILAGFE